MSKYNVGDKFLLEIEEIIKSKDKTMYKMKDFNVLIFDNSGLKRLPRVKEYTTFESELNFRKGDEVIVENGKAKDGDPIIYFVTRIDGINIHGINRKGTIHCYPAYVLKKTGKHSYELDGILNAAYWTFLD